MKWLSSIAIMLSIVNSMYSQELTVLNLSFSGGPTPTQTTSIESYVVNDTNKNLIVVTRIGLKKPITYFDSKGDLVIIYTFDEEFDLQGRRIVHPSCDFGVVELKKGEVAKLDSVVLDKKDFILKDHSVHVTYKVTKQFAETENVWEGTLSADGQLPRIKILER